MVKGLNALFAVMACLVLAGCCGGIDLGCGCEAESPCAAPDAPCAAPVSAAPAGMPDEAKAGEAWCRVWVPPTYETYEEQVIAEPAGCKKEWVEPVYEEQERQVCTKPASTKRINIPAVYKDVEKRVCVRKASRKRINIPAEYDTREEQVMTCAARTEWRKVECTPKQLAEGQKQGDCWMLVEIPAQYKSVSKRICTKEASCTFEEIPAEFDTITEKVLVTPAACTTETIAPEYETRSERVMVKKGFYKTLNIPATYETVTKKKCTGPGRWEWRRNGDCEVPDAAE